MKLTRSELILVIVIFAAIGAGTGFTIAALARVMLTMEQTQPYRMPTDCSFGRGEC